MPEPNIYLASYLVTYLCNTLCLSLSLFLSLSLYIYIYIYTVTHINEYSSEDFLLFSSKPKTPSFYYL